MIKKSKTKKSNKSLKAHKSLKGYKSNKLSTKYDEKSEKEYTEKNIQTILLKCLIHLLFICLYYISEKIV
jgi:hypothetical protein